MIWIIGGTSDANKLSAMIKNAGHDVLVSTTTAYGTQLANQCGIKIIEQKLQPEEMSELITQENISCVVDASHPFAQEVSSNAIKVCSNKNVPYIRFERENIRFENVSYYSNYSLLVEALQTSEGNIMLTIGSKNLHLFNALDLDRLVARVLPVKESIEECNNAGLKAHQIIASKGIMVKETNRALFTEYEIKHLVTKDSGEAGGMAQKIEAANEMGINVHILERPELNYPEVYNSFEEILAKIKIYG